ncbi:MAG: hypothetical protein AB1Z23_01090 [Eubacteriales bacterium]
MILVIIGSALLIIWGIAHLIPTKGVVSEFGEISLDNKRIIYMEWINEGLTLIFMGVLMILLASFGTIGSTVNTIAAVCVIVMLAAMSVLSLLTGFKVNFIPYKLCPVIFSISAILIAIGSFI